MRYMFCWFLFLLITPSMAQPDTAQKIIWERSNSLVQQKKPYVIMISADGFRHDYAEKHGASFLAETGRQNVKAAYMMPSYPSVTFPNHYTLVTGLYPSHHGLVDNNFYDRQFAEVYTMSRTDKVREAKWYGGIPLWVLAEQQQMLSASFYWVGSESPVQRIFPTYHYTYNEKISIEKRIQVVVDWLQLPEDRRPHLITFYFPEVDHSGHTYGPDATETGRAVRFVDSAIKQLTIAVEKTGLDVNYIFVADHGMTKVNTETPLRIPAIDTSKAVVIPGGEIVQVYVKDAPAIDSLYGLLKRGEDKYKVYKKTQLPARLHYGKKDDVYNRIGNILLVADWPYIFVAPGKKPKSGAHGYDAFVVPDMRTVFYAWGPAFKKNKKIAPIQNVDVFPVVASILGLHYTHKIDGSKKPAKKMLR